MAPRGYDERVYAHVSVKILPLQMLLNREISLIRSTITWQLWADVLGDFSSGALDGGNAIPDEYRTAVVEARIFKIKNKNLPPH